jgi:hypothetical protein
MSSLNRQYPQKSQSISDLKLEIKDMSFQNLQKVDFRNVNSKNIQQKCESSSSDSLARGNN